MIFTTFLVALVTQGPPRLGGTSQNGSFELRNFDARGFTIDLLTGRTTFNSNGDPLLLRQLDRGLTLTSKHMEGAVATVPGQGQVLQSATATGAARLVLSTQDASAYLKSVKKPVPTGPEERTQLDSDTMTYQLTGEVGKTTLPNALTLTQIAQGAGVTEDKAKLPLTFEQNMTIKGTQGTFEFRLAPEGGKPRPLTGVVSGPVTVDFARTEKVKGESAPRRQTLHADCDRVEYDFTKAEHTITAIGHVKIHTTLLPKPTPSDPTPEAQSYDTEGDQYTIVVDDHYQPIRIRAAGTPVRTVVPPVGVRP